MLSEKEIEALKNGAYGITREGYKAKYLGVCEGEDEVFHTWVIYNENGSIKESVDAYDTFVSYYRNHEDRDDIIGLWQDKPEPFDLEKVLNGEPFKVSHEKRFAAKKVENSLIYYSINEDGELDRIFRDDIPFLQENAFMWKEPEPTKSEYKELPKPTSIHINKTDEYQVKLRFGSDEDYNVWAKHIRKHADKLFYKV
ncbi:hypothetical protein BKK47_03405 [Rodentibacter mrazii]|uniref:PH domain-containing protein n=1 Tax=Rodentibacter mrazii TaxID=1908257 RepID=A0A1V3IHJ5_9PAST|nr:hypothetical protein [Rodentibacter mrazii]OOF40665.1 hypothetical protein BKK47_03405 [Rodentibacter mrazii]